MATNWGTSSSSKRQSVDEKVLEVRYVRTLNGGGEAKQEFEEASAATFEAGQLVTITTAGQIQEAAAGNPVAGVALFDKTGTQGSLIPVQLATPEAVFSIKADGDVTVAVVGESGDLIVTGGVHLADISSFDAVGGQFTCVGLMSGATDSAHANYRRIFVTVRESFFGQDAQAVA